MKKIVILLILVITFSGCEKDDICVDETTPQLVIEFFDISNPAVLKNVVNLKVTAEGMSTALNTFNGVSKISLPLKTNEDTTKYHLVLNSNSSTASTRLTSTKTLARFNTHSWMPGSVTTTTCAWLAIRIKPFTRSPVHRVSFCEASLASTRARRSCS
jgi:hypothetical protein